MAFIPVPSAMQLRRFLSFFVNPTTISWNQSDDMYLVDANVRVDDGGLPPPATRPFRVSGQNEEGGVTYATLSFRSRDCSDWKEEFRANRQVILTMNVDGADEDLRVQLSSAE
jgi:hypothetical protein